jgi:hypothetical protein
MCFLLCFGRSPSRTWRFQPKQVLDCDLNFYKICLDWSRDASQLLYCSTPVHDWANCLPYLCRHHGGKYSVAFGSNCKVLRREIQRSVTVSETFSSRIRKKIWKTNTSMRQRSRSTQTNKHQDIMNLQRGEAPLKTLSFVRLEIPWNSWKRWKNAPEKSVRILKVRNINREQRRE